jgi:glycosyltransferase involved in cell wall biosynthesis
MPQGPSAMTFSIITPSFRNSDWLKLCVASVADQGVDLEHIVQDAGSDDGTLDWLPHDRRVKAFVEKDEGMYDAINRGLRRASGEILAYLNCDEQYLPGALSRVGAFFRAHPLVDVLFADAVVVNPEGGYLFHRKIQVPQLWHTWIFPLSTLTCATFFRRRVITEHQLFFNARWRIVSDQEWVFRLLQRGLSFAALHKFTSAFTLTGSNLSCGKHEKREREFQATVPLWLKAISPLVLLHHRLRKLLSGAYSQKPFTYSICTRRSLDQRVTFDVANPTGRWRW